MKNTILLLIWLLPFLGAAQAQLYTPVHFQKAYEAGTRSIDGRPGPNYWQNRAKYDIQVKVNSGSWTIEGRETVKYYNNSPDVLRFLVVRLFANQYELGAARDEKTERINLTEGVRFSEVTINQRPVSQADLEDLDKTSTVAYLKLPVEEPLEPGDSVTLTMAWNASLPLQYKNRIGAFDSTSAFMGYWYPMIGVYDDIEGWDENEYLGNQEFYRDFADYQVTLEVPAGYFVLATGELMNPEEVFSKKGLHEYRKAGLQNIKVKLSEAGMLNGEGHSSKWIFKAENVQDFAAGISDRLTWESGSVQIGDRRVRSHVAYDPDSRRESYDVLAWQNKALTFLSKCIPGVDYPYPQFSSFYGVPELDGMEFPMIANNGFAFDDVTDAEVNFHELVHTLFPFYMGINEVQYSWMEEGWAIFYTIKYIQDAFEASGQGQTELERNLFSFNTMAGGPWDGPLFQPSINMVQGDGHVISAYRKPAFMYLVLEDMIGEVRFQESMREYVRRWAGRHPIPHDFLYTFNEVSREDLNWFWEKWVFQYAYPDIGLAAYNSGELIVENIGGLPMPVRLILHYADGTHQRLNIPARIWKAGRSTEVVGLERTDGLESIELDTSEFPDVNADNNRLMVPR